jgi:hypothetical protein
VVAYQEEIKSEIIVIKSVPAGATQEDIIRALKTLYGHYQLTVAYRSQLKARNQLNHK